MTAVFVAAGSNIEPVANLRRALDVLERRYPTLRCSRAYRNAAVGFEGEDFVNLVVAFETDDDVRGVLARLHEAEAACGRDPAGVAAHHFQHEHLGRGARHRGHVEACLADRDGDIFGDRPEARTAIGDRQVIVHGLRHVDRGERIAELSASTETLRQVSAESPPPL